MSRRGKTPLKNDDDLLNKAEFPFVSLFVEGKLSEDMVKQQIQIMLMVGHESTGMTIAQVILILAMHPNIQEQVLDELRSVFNTQDEETTYEHIKKLNLLDRVIKETLRLFPPAGSLLRLSTADVPISSYVLPKNTIIHMRLYTLHRV